MIMALARDISATEMIRCKRSLLINLGDLRMSGKIKDLSALLEGQK